MLIQKHYSSGQFSSTKNNLPMFSKIFIVWPPNVDQHYFDNNIIVIFTSSWHNILYNYHIVLTQRKISKPYLLNKSYTFQKTSLASFKTNLRNFLLHDLK